MFSWSGTSTAADQQMTRERGVQEACPKDTAEHGHAPGRAMSMVREGDCDQRHGLDVAPHQNNLWRDNGEQPRRARSRRVSSHTEAVSSGRPSATNVWARRGTWPCSRTCKASLRSEGKRCCACQCQVVADCLPSALSAIREGCNPCHRPFAIRRCWEYNAGRSGGIVRSLLLPPSHTQASVSFFAFASVVLVLASATICP
ncbi:hypothetical protein BD413DRAFT_226774 [Trametes elegans]|nr:hypothetical protein BD413DRAFT_226774 [Trametes elegans]